MSRNPFSTVGNRHAAARSARRAGERGVSLFEAKLGLMGLLLLAVGITTYVASASEDDRRAASERDVKAILKAADTYLSEDGSGCPTVSSLKRDRQLNQSARASDAWGERFRITCSRSDIRVFSAGPDGQLDSKDDVRASRSRI